MKAARLPILPADLTFEQGEAEACDYSTPRWL
jgi:hypothetical protein